MSSSKQKLQRSFSTPSASSSTSGLDCDLKLRGKSVGVTPELKYSKSLQEDSPSNGEAAGWVKVLICFSRFFLEIFLVNICLLISLVNVTLADLLLLWDSNWSEVWTISYNIIIGPCCSRGRLDLTYCCWYYLIKVMTGEIRESIINPARTQNVPVSHF